MPPSGISVTTRPSLALTIINSRRARSNLNISSLITNTLLRGVMALLYSPRSRACSIKICGMNHLPPSRAKFNSKYHQVNIIISIIITQKAQRIRSPKETVFKAKVLAKRVVAINCASQVLRA